MTSTVAIKERAPLTKELRTCWCRWSGRTWRPRWMRSRSSARNSAAGPAPHLLREYGAAQVFAGDRPSRLRRDPGHRRGASDHGPAPAGKHRLANASRAPERTVPGRPVSLRSGARQAFVWRAAPWSGREVAAGALRAIRFVRIGIVARYNNDHSPYPSGRCIRVVWQRRQLQHDGGDGAGHAIVGVGIARFECDRNGCTVVDKNGNADAGSGPRELDCLGTGRWIGVSRGVRVSDQRGQVRYPAQGYAERHRDRHAN